MFFTTLDSEQCFNVSITDDSECEYNEHCEDEMFMCVLEIWEGSRVMAVEPRASVYIQDGDDCGMTMINISIGPYKSYICSTNIVYYCIIIMIVYTNAAIFTERVNLSCTPVSTPNVLITPSQSVTMMDESSSRDKYATTLVWIVLSLVGLLLFLAIIVVVGIICYIRKKTKKQKFAKTRSAKSIFFSFGIMNPLMIVVMRMILMYLRDTPPLVSNSYSVKNIPTMLYGLLCR